MTPGAEGRAGIRAGRVRTSALAVGVLVAALLVGWVAVHLTMPSWYARWWYPLEHAGLIRGEAAANGLEPDLVAAVIYRESKFTESARSEQGAVGLMQVLPETAEWIHRQRGGPSATPDRLAEPAVNIAYGTWYLHYLTDKYGDGRLALAAYNGGETNLREWIATARRSGRTLRLVDVPFVETRRFVVAVEEAQDVYRRAWGSALR